MHSPLASNLSLLASTGSWLVPSSLPFRHLVPFATSSCPCSLFCFSALFLFLLFTASTPFPTQIFQVPSLASRYHSVRPFCSIACSILLTLLLHFPVLVATFAFGSLSPALRHHATKKIKEDVSLFTNIRNHFQLPPASPLCLG